MAQYGIKEVMNFTVCEYNPDIKVAKPVLSVDYAQVTDVQNTAERLDIQGGRGNKKLLSFDHSKVASIPVTIPLVDLRLLSEISGDKIEEKIQEIFKREVLTVKADNGKAVVELAKVPVERTLFVHTLEGFRDLGEPLTVASVTGTVDAGEYELTVTGSKAVIEVNDTTNPVGSEIIVFYHHETTKPVTTMSFNPELFPKAVTVKGDTLFRNQYTEEDEVFNFVAYKGKFQPNYTLSMNATSATVLELTLDLYAYKDKDTQTEKYYDFIAEEVA